MADYASCAPGLDCVGLSCPALSVACPAGTFCGNWTLQAAADQAWVAKDIRYWEEVPAGVSTPKWIEDTCPKGEYCLNNGTASVMLDCPAGSWCPRAVNAAFPCDPLSVCGKHASYQVNFIAVILALLVSAVVAAASCTLRQRQQAAARACRGNPAPLTKPLDSRRPASALQQSASVNSTSTASFGEQGSATPAAMAAATGAPAGESLGADLEGAAGGPVSALPTSPFSRPGGGLSFAAADLSVTLSSGRCILTHATASIPAGAVTAVMGASGCGKTTLLNVLRGHSPGTVGGIVSLNGAPLTGAGLAALRRRVGFVPQEDVLDRHLTPRELITLSAQLRLPAHVVARPGGVEAAVDAVLITLGLCEVADVVLGGGTNAAASISGGQMKRVSVGVELVALPEALWLDEPTSGLDSSSALDLVVTLKAIAHSGVTVACVLHQPRSEVWAMMDHVVLLAAGGRGTVFEGPPARALTYFTSEAVGYALPRRVAYNPADVIMDIVTGMVSVTNTNAATTTTTANLTVADTVFSHAADGTGIAHPGTPGGGGDLVASWAASAESGGKGSAAEGLQPPPTSPTSSSSSSSSSVAASSRGGGETSFLRQAWLQSKRGFIVRMRDAAMLRLYAFLHVLLGCALAVGFSPIIQG